MKILVIGSGGREHAIAVKLAESRHAPTLYFAPGNPGMANLGMRLDIDVTDIEGLKIFAEREHIDLTVVGPEVPLSLGIVDTFTEAGLSIFGPCKAAATLEASKHFAKQIMDDAGIPTASFAYCTTEAEAFSALDRFTPPYVIKEDGLAAGKGVTVTAADLTRARSEAEAAIQSAMAKKMPVVIEEFLAGEELSLLAVCDGNIALPLISAQDFKRVGENNTGPNTGGMGAYAPVPFATQNLIGDVQAKVLTPLVQAMAKRGTPYKGILYAGLMISPTGEVKVIEFNVRFGDPETQVVLPLMQSDLVDVMLASAKGNLSAYFQTGIEFYPNQCAVTVVLASNGYPGEFEKGKPIQIGTLPEKVHAFHAGTKTLPDQTLVTHGGRVMTITGMGNSLEAARTQAYAGVEAISFENKYARPDIAKAAANTPLTV